MFELQISILFRKLIENILENAGVQNVLINKTAKIHQLPTIEQCETHLRRTYPTVYYAFLKAMGRYKEVMRLYDGSPSSENMTWYIQGELALEFDRLRAEGKLKQNNGTTKVDIEEVTYDYSGELNQQGLPHGFGICKSRLQRWEGTFVDGKLEGVCM